MNNDNSDAGQTSNVAPMEASPTVGAPTKSPKAEPDRTGVARAKVVDISGRIPSQGDDAQDLAVLEVRIPRSGLTVGSTTRIRESSVVKAGKLRVYRKLGFSAKTWKVQKLLAAEEFSDAMAEKIVARVMAVDSFDSMEQIKIAERVCTEMLQKTDLVPEVRLQAVNMMSAITAARVKMQEHILKLAEKARNGDAKQEQRKVLPPIMPTQVVAGQGSQVFVGASSGREAMAMPVNEE